MKKISVFLFTVTASLILCLNASAIQNVNFHLSVSQQEKENAVISVNISESSELYTTEFYIGFDSDKLEFVNGSENAGAACAGLSPYITANEIEPGRIKVSYTCTQPLVSSGELISLGFEVREDSLNKFTLEIEHAETFDGKDISELSFSADGCEAELTKTAKPLQTALAIGLPVLAVILIAAAVKIKNK